MTKSRVSFAVIFLSLVVVSGCTQSVKILTFKPLSESEKLVYQIDFNHRGEVSIFRNHIDPNDHLLDLGITADNRPLIFSSGQKALELVNNGQDTGVNDLWLIDGTLGNAQILTESEPLYAIDESENYICLYSGYSFKNPATTMDNNIVLAQIVPFVVIKTFTVKSEVSGNFWGRDLNNERIKDSTFPLRFDKDSNTFVFKMVNSERYVEQYSIDIKTATLIKTAVSTVKVHLP